MASHSSEVDNGAELLVAALQTVAQPVWVVDHDGAIRFANAAAVRALGYSGSEELIGRNSHATIHHHRPDGSAYPVADCPMLRPRMTGETVTNELDWFFRRDGSMFRVAYVSAPLDVSGERGAVVAFTDIEAQARAEDALRDREGSLVDEQAALRRVALAVAEGSGPESVFRVMADQVRGLLGSDESAIVRFEPDGTVTIKGAYRGRNQVGARVAVSPDYVIAAVRKTGQAARVDSDDPTAGGVPETMRGLGIRSRLASPIVIDGELWGAITIASRDHPLPAGTEGRLDAYTELVAAAISNAQAREDLQRLADEQAALRRVATLVAREGSQADVFTAVAEEIGHVLGTDLIRMVRYEDGPSTVVVAAWGSPEDVLPVGFRQPLGGENALTRVFDTCRPARVDDYSKASGQIAETVRTTAIRCVVAVPVVVQGRLWGAMTTATMRDEPLAPDTESRLSQFTELMATAISNADAHAEVERLVREQSSLRRVATLVAKEASLTEVFATVAEAVVDVVGDVECTLVRDESQGTGIAVAAWGGVVAAAFPVATQVPVDGDGIVAAVIRDGRAHRIDDASAVGGRVAQRAAQLGLRSAVGCPIVVGGRTWGAMVVARRTTVPLPPETETCVAQFSELVATAIANSEARAEVERLAEQQAALRRVATVAAEGREPADIFATVCDEVARLFGAHCVVARFDAEGPAIVFVGIDKSVEAKLPVGTRWVLDDSMAAQHVYLTGASGRADNVDWSSRPGVVADVQGGFGIVSSVASPIVVEGLRWGVVSVASSAPLPRDTEERLQKFTELIAIAIADAESRKALRQLAGEQAALRRVATLVAEGAPPTALFDGVVAEMGEVLGADGVTLSRYESGDQLTFVASHGSDPRGVPTGTRVGHQGENVASLVRRTRRSARIEHRQQPGGAIAGVGREAGIRASVGAPIIVEGKLWGVAIATWRGETSPPPDTEERMAQFAELLDTAIANADSRAQLTASRERLLTEADEARRRVVRDLHDGAQQRIVQTILILRAAEEAIRDNDEHAESLVGQALDGAEQGIAELRELAHGILPPILTHGGLRAAINTIVTRLDLAVDVEVSRQRFPSEIEASAYFIVAEALTNVVKHAQARHAEVKAVVLDGMLRVEVCDDGVGGADPAGHGLVGMSDRVMALGGRLEIANPPDGGTLVAATLPLSGE
ncbi:MAG TPA: GAF domain-containing protein [Jatrophihabitans sp.]|nr:GAF domain-containing protein [Jatrophihabitans sp.]